MFSIKNQRSTRFKQYNHQRKLFFFYKKNSSSVLIKKILTVPASYNLIKEYDISSCYYFHFFSYKPTLPLSYFYLLFFVYTTSEYYILFQYDPILHNLSFLICRT